MINFSKVNTEYHMKKIALVSLVLSFLVCNTVFASSQSVNAKKVSPAGVKKIQTSGTTLNEKKDGNKKISPLYGLKITTINQINSSFTSKSVLLKFPLADFNLSSGKDSDRDGLSDDIETALGTNPLKKNTNGNGYDDKMNLLHGYNPILPGHVKLAYDQKDINTAKGKLVSEATVDKKNWFFWYVHPITGKIYYIGKSESETDTDALLKKAGIILDTQSVRQSSTEAAKKDFRDRNPTASIKPQLISFTERPKSEAGTEYVLAGLQLMVPRKDAPVVNKSTYIVGRIAWSDKQEIIVNGETIVFTSLLKKCTSYIPLSPRDAYVAAIYMTPDVIDAKMSDTDMKTALRVLFTKLDFLSTLSLSKDGTLYEFINSMGVHGFYADAVYGTTLPQILVFTSPDHYFTIYLKGMTKSDIDFILSSLRVES